MLRKILSLVFGLTLMATGLDAQILSYRITDATLASTSGDGMKTVGQYPARHAEIDLDGQVITLSGKKIQSVTLDFNQIHTIMNSAVAKRAQYLYQGRLVCDRIVTPDTGRCELTIYLKDGSYISLTGKCIGEE